MAFFTSSTEQVSFTQPVLKVVDDSHFELLSEFYFVPPEYARTSTEKYLHECASEQDTSKELYIKVVKRTTDLASVPPPLWGLMASYGRQTLPALLHDQLCDSASASARQREAREDGNAAMLRSARTQRRHADDLFRHALRGVHVEWMRRWTFWAGVTFGRHWRFSRPLAIALGAMGLTLSCAFFAGLALLASGAWDAIWNWPVRAPDAPESRQMLTGLAVSVGALLIPCIAGRHPARPLLQVTAYVGLPALAVLALGCAALVWTRFLPWALLWALSRLPLVSTDPGPAPPIKPTGPGFM